MRTIFALCALAVTMTGNMVAQEPAKAEESAFGAEIDLQFSSAYLWRGQFINDEAVFQPSVDLSCGDFGVYTWFNCDLTKQEGADRRCSEVDVNVYYSIEAEPLTVEIGHVSYLPTESVVGDTTNHSTHEIYIEASAETPVVTPVLSISYDYDEAEGFYTSLALKREVDIGGDITLTPSVAAGYGSKDYNSYYFDVARDKGNDGSAALAVEWQQNDTCSYGLTLIYSWPLNSEIRNAMRDADSSKDTEGFVCKASAKISF